MTMFRKSLIAGLVATVATMGLTLPADALGRRDEQDAARKARLDGHVIPFSIIKRRVDAEMAGATYVGSEFSPGSNRYRLKYVRDGKVMWVDADGRTGDIIGMAR